MVQGEIPLDGTTSREEGASTRSEERVREQKRRILLAASHAFREHGFHATGMRAIAASLGMTVGNLYYYFRNKQELLAFCQEETVSRLLALAEWVEARALSAPDRLYLLLVGGVLCLNEGTPGSLAHIEVEALDPEWRARIQAERDRFEEVVTGVLAAGCEDGSFRAVDPRIAAYASLGAVNWTVKWFRPDRRFTAGEIGEQFAEQLVRGVLAEGEPWTPPDASLPPL